MTCKENSDTLCIYWNMVECVTWDLLCQGTENFAFFALCAGLTTVAPSPQVLCFYPLRTG